MDRNAALIGQYVHGAKAGGHPNVCCIHYTSHDIFNRTIANDLVAWFSDGHTERCAHGQFNG